MVFRSARIDKARTSRFRVFLWRRGFLATWKRFFWFFSLSHRPGCRPVDPGATTTIGGFATSPFGRKSSGSVSRGPKHSSARSPAPSAHHEDHLRILLRLPRHARGVRPRGHRVVRHLRHAQVRARRVTFLSASFFRGRRRITTATSPLTPASPAPFVFSPATRQRARRARRVRRGARKPSRVRHLPVFPRGVAVPRGPRVFVPRVRRVHPQRQRARRRAQPVPVHQRQA